MSGFFRFLRGKDCPIDAEVDEMMLCCKKANMGEGERRVDAEESLLEKKLENDDKGGYYAMLFPPLWRSSVLMALVGLCGIDGIYYYGLTVFREARMVVSNYGAIIAVEVRRELGESTSDFRKFQLGISVGYFSINPFMDRLPRRWLAAGSSAMMAMSHVALSFALWHGSGEQEVAQMTWTESFCYFSPPFFNFLFAAGYGGGLGMRGQNGA